MRDARRLIRRYYAFRATNSAGFYVPVAILFLRDSGFSLRFVGLAYAVFGFATLVAEIPTGYLGDWLGRRWSLALGALLRASVLVAYPFAGSAAAFLGLHVVWAAGRSFRSGTQDAWLYELLATHLDEGEFARIESRGSAVLLLTSAGGAVAGGVLYGVDPAYPFFVNAALALFGLPLLLGFPPVADGQSDSDVFTVGEAVSMLGVQVARPEVRWFVAFAGLFDALFLVTRIYEQPALDAVGVPVTGLGVLYAGFKLSSAVAASTVGRLEETLGVRGVFLSLIPVYALAYASVAFVPVLVVPVLFLNRGLRVVTRPIRNQYLNDRLDDVGRATVLSGASMAFALLGVLARLCAGWAVGFTGPVDLLPWAGLLVGGGAALLWLVASPVRTGANRSESPSGSGSTTD